MSLTCRLLNAQSCQHMMHRPIRAKRRNGGKEMGVTAQHTADRSTSKQFARSQKSIKYVIQCTNERPNTSCLILRTMTLTCPPIQNFEPAVVKNESETLKWNRGKAPSGKVDIQNSGQPTVTTNCVPARQCPLCQGSKRRLNAPNRYGMGVTVSAVTKVDDRNEIKTELLPETAEFRNPRK